MANNGIPRIYITITNGIAEVRAVDGEVHVIMVDCDREGNDPLSPEEAHAEFVGGVESGTTEAFDAAVATDRDAFTRDFVETARPTR